MKKETAATAPTDLSLYQIKKTNPIWKVLVYILLLVWTAINLYPLFWMLMYSLKSDQEILHGNPVALPQEWLWDHYPVVLERLKLFTLLKNSVLIAFATIVITVFAALMATYAITRIKWKLSGAVNSFLMLGLTIPIHSALIPLFIIFKKVIPIYDTVWALIVPYSAFSLSMAILISSGFMVDIPYELDEAAHIDGCGLWGIFLRVIVPLMKPAFATVSIYTFLQCWNEYMLASLLCEKVKTIPVGIATFTGAHDAEYALAGTGLVLATIPTILIYVFLSNRIQESFIAGAIKG